MHNSLWLYWYKIYHLQTTLYEVMNFTVNGIFYNFPSKIVWLRFVLRNKIKMQGLNIYVQYSFESIFWPVSLEIRKKHRRFIYRKPMK